MRRGAGRSGHRKNALAGRTERRDARRVNLDALTLSNFFRLLILLPLVAVTSQRTVPIPPLKACLKLLEFAPMPRMKIGWIAQRPMSATCRREPPPTSLQL